MKSNGADTTLGPALLRYLLGGLVIGGLWYLNRERPVWQEVMRTVLVFSIGMVLLQRRLSNRGVVVHLVPLIATKAVLVVIAAYVEVALRDDGTPHSALLVALGLGVAVCLVGAVADRRFFSPADPTPAPDRSLTGVARR